MSDYKTIIRKVSERTGVPIEKMLSKARSYEIAHARQRAMFALRKSPLAVARTGAMECDKHRRSLPMIARTFDVDHTTALYSVRREAFRRGLGPDPRAVRKAAREARRTQTEAGE